MVRGSGASTSGAGTYTYSWKSFEERVLLEPDSSSSSVNGPSNTEADESAKTSGDPYLDQEELSRKKVESKNVDCEIAREISSISGIPLTENLGRFELLRTGD